jgi:hypothetical protein
MTPFRGTLPVIFHQTYLRISALNLRLILRLLFVFIRGLPPRRLGGGGSIRGLHSRF